MVIGIFPCVPAGVGYMVYHFFHSFFSYLNWLEIFWLQVTENIIQTSLIKGMICHPDISLYMSDLDAKDARVGINWKLQLLTHCSSKFLLLSTKITALILGFILH